MAGKQQLIFKQKKTWKIFGSHFVVPLAQPLALLPGCPLYLFFLYCSHFLSKVEQKNTLKSIGKTKKKMNKKHSKIKTFFAVIVLAPGALLAWAVYALAMARAENQNKGPLYSNDLANTLTGALPYLAFLFWLLAATFFISQNIQIT